MTSYANDTTTTTTAAAAAAGAGAGAGNAAAAAAAIGGATHGGVAGVAGAVESSRVKDKSRDTLHIGGRYSDDDGNSSDGREKADTTPENIKKIAEIMDQSVDKVVSAPATPQAQSQHPSPRHQLLSQVNPGFVGLGAAIDESSGKFCLGKPPPSPAEKAAAAQSRANHQKQQIGNNRVIAGEAEEEDNSTESNSTTTATKQALAFTIDHFEASENDAAAQAARYKNMMERFQNRHKRGASMSKLETENVATTTTGTNSGGRQSQRSSLDAGSSMADDTPSSEQAPQVRLRVRERSASRVRDASKRHSWSPRSSGTSAPEPAPAPTNRAASRSKLPPPAANKGAANLVASAKGTKGAANLVANRTANQFTPRSTAMQLALRQVEMLCPQPPLADGKSLSEDAVSEAGTYTLDGDNYTEEQKDLMNIDRNAAAAAAKAAAAAAAAEAATGVKMRPKQLPVKSNRGSNVLEVNFYHETPLQEHPTQQQKQSQTQKSSTGAYLDQLKSRVLRQQAPLSPPTPPSPAADVGCFTSVTTSGVLAKQRALDTHPNKLTRHSHSHSLSTSQIDSSEYVSNEAKLRHTQALSGSATDRQKAEYRLNVFTTSTTQQQAPHHQHQQQKHQLPETPPTPTQTSDTALMQTAQTKQDWIQEWARNARARSLAQDVSGTSASRRQQQAQAQAQAQKLMTRSYNCSDTGGDSLTDDSLSLYNQQRQYAAAAKLNRGLAERYRLLGDCDYASDPALCSHGGGGQAVEPPYKPPKSPSKIPSPLHTLGRTRSASRSRPQTDAYLEQTAAAISNLQQSLSRRSSVKSPAQSSPQHSLEAGAGGGYRRSPLHRALMTSSINEAQLQLLTSGEYLLKQLRRRKNSLDDVEHVEHLYDYEKAPPEAAAPLSPLRRSSSFQQQQQQQGQSQHPVRQARPNFQNLYTPPAARHAHALSMVQQLKKSASSNNFDQAYSDYDNELQYYINDEDELGTTGAYYSSNEEEDEVEQSQGSVPLTNTRMNKALLMRIERSKQRVAGAGQTQAKPSSAPAGKLNAAQTGAGLVACPNTPELPRRGIRSASRAAPGSAPKTRQSMPRETSLSRLAQQVPSSLANAKKQLLQTANASREQRVQPKYMDISKYKPAQSNSFLRKNDAKSTLKPADQMKRSPSASSMGLSRGEGTRASNRSVRSNVSAMNTSTTSLGGGTRASSAARRDASANKQKEAEMAMWKRRSTYDPMKAAAEDRRRKEEARRAQSQSQSQQQMNDEADETPFESVLRPTNNMTITGGGHGYSPRNSVENDAWTLGESSEYGEYMDDYDENEEAEADEQQMHDYVGQESDDVFETETAEAAAQGSVE
ncbi:mediator of RNA polymerase II transcription subunit 12 [Drosophila guanche]|uniref:Uncharacterized protein n=2 Tax=Drosophila guanche TaxID=7266 RepID=A0A3B0JTN1_DROGU|nr:mediator of RNA polymerase II transcription subunit 12 [Drosophila guanche]XP_034120753.1 mediator of RNA polymerase II transcription subunit 12 [Drosophila guanche]SPP77049.1 Hypothetical predicted protein [Drosophila guanche]